MFNFDQFVENEVQNARERRTFREFRAHLMSNENQPKVAAANIAAMGDGGFFSHTKFGESLEGIVGLTLPDVNGRTGTEIASAIGMSVCRTIAGTVGGITKNVNVDAETDPVVRAAKNKACQALGASELGLTISTRKPTDRERIAANIEAIRAACLRLS